MYCIVDIYPSFHLILFAFFFSVLLRLAHIFYDIGFEAEKCSCVCVCLSLLCIFLEESKSTIQERSIEEVCCDETSGHRTAPVGAVIAREKL